MTLSVVELQPVLHDLFRDTADEMARRCGFCKRARKLTGPVFAQSLVFSFLEKPDATLEDFSETADDLGVAVTPQAFDKRFTPAAADFMHNLFFDAFNHSFRSLQPALLPLLRRFTSVHLRDGSSIPLPSSLAPFFPGRSNAHIPKGKAAAVKLVLEAEVTTGGLTDASLLAGTDNEKIAEVASKPLPEGSLLLEDMGFLCGERMQEYMDQGVYVLARIPAWTAVFDLNGKALDLVQLLRHYKWDYLDRPVKILSRRKLQVRLIAARVPEEVAEERRQRVRKEAKERGRPVSQKKLDLCAWNILVTNASKEKIGCKEACVIRRVRWQVELVFKVFKSEGQIDQTRSEDPSRVLSELYAKLLAMVVQQWSLLAAGYQMLKHSARRAARRVRRLAKKLLAGLGQIEKVGRVVARLARQLYRHCQIVRRKTDPSTLDRLMALDPEFDLPQIAA
jgi:hypothetical protein